MVDAICYEINNFTIPIPLFVKIFIFLNFSRLLGKLVFKRWTQFPIQYSVYDFTLIYLSLSIFSFFSTFLVFLNFFWQVEKICLWTVDAICYDINNFTLLYLSVWRFLFFSTFRFSQLFSIDGETCLWTIGRNSLSNTVYIILPSFTFPCQYFHFSRLLLVFLNFFLASWENLSLNGGCNSLWNK